MSEIQEETKERSTELPPISVYIWKPWYAKLYWSLTASLWLVGSDWVQGLPYGVARGLTIASIFTAPPIVFLVLAFGRLERFIHDPNRTWEGGHLVGPALYPFESGPSGLCPSVDPLDPRSGIHWQFNPNNPTNPFYETRNNSN